MTMGHPKNWRSWLMKISLLGAAALTLGVAVTHSSQPTFGAEEGSAKVTLVDKAEFKKGALIPFDLIYQVPNNKLLNKLVLYDPLDPVFEFQEAKVYDGTHDVTDQGKLDFDKATNTPSWNAAKPGDWFNKQLLMRVTVKIPENADLSKYLDKNTNKYRMYNTGHMITDDDDIPSPPVEINTPDDKLPSVGKLVINHEGEYVTSAKHAVGEDYTYKLTYHIPKNEKITNVEFKDDEEDVLKLKKVVVKDPNGRDVTAESGKLVIDPDTESYVWTANKDTLETMGDTDYTVFITQAIKENVDLSKYYNKDTKQIEIPNFGEMVFNTDTIKSDPVKVIPEDSLKPTIGKEVKGLSGKYSDHDDVKVGEEYSYQVPFSFPTNVKMTDVELSDDLEDVLDLLKVTVTNDSDKDVTDTDGTLKTDDASESFIWTPKDVASLGGKKYVATITTKIKPGANLDKYLVNGKIVIGNTAHLKIDKTDNPSPEAKVTPETVEPKVDKKLVANPDQLSDVFHLGTTTDKTDDTTKTDKTTGDGNSDAKLNDAKPLTETGKTVTGTTTSTSKTTTDEKTGSTTTKTTTSTNTPALTVGEQEPVNSSAAIDISKVKNASLVDNNNAKPGDIVMHLLTFTIGNKEPLTRLILSDDLENVFDLKEVKLFDDKGVDISQQGQLLVDQDKESWDWVPAKPADWYNKVVYAISSSKIKTTGPDSDLSPYKKGDYYEVPNIGQMLQNTTNYLSPKVVTRLSLDPKKDEPDTPEKESSSSSSSSSSASSSSQLSTKDPEKTSSTPVNPDTPVASKQAGLLPQTGRYVIQHKALLVTLLVTVIAAAVMYLWRKDAIVKEVHHEDQ
jgi:fimbrial isopeptide formation D2 family protein